MDHYSLVVDCRVPSLAGTTIAEGRAFPVAQPRRVFQAEAQATALDEHLEGPRLRVRGRVVSGRSRRLGAPDLFVLRFGRWLTSTNKQGDRFYSAYPGGSNRVSTASSVDQRSWTHSRGPSTSSNFSVSTAASSIPSSPVLPCIPEPVSPKPSRVPLTPRTAQRRQNEAAGLDAVNQYFQRVRLSQIEEVASTKDSRRASTARASTKSAGSGSTETKDADRPAQGLAIFDGTSSPDEQIVFDGTSAPDEVVFEDEPVFEIVAKAKRCSKALQHSRTQSHDLEIEFIETGHTTFTPLSVDRNSDNYPSTFILPEDAFALPAASPAVILYPVSTPSAASTFEGSAESHDTAATGSTGTTIAAHHRRSPLLPHHLGPALDELSEFFSARVPELSSGSSSTGSSCSSGGSASDDVSPAGAYPPPTFAPSAPISPLRKHAPRFGSVSSIPTPRVVDAPLARQRRQSASFTAAQRARMVANGQANPSLVERHVYYDWI